MKAEADSRGRGPAGRALSVPPARIVGDLGLVAVLVACLLDGAAPAALAQAPADALAAARQAIASGQLDEAERLANAVGPERGDAAWILAAAAEARGQMDRAEGFYAWAVAHEGGADAALDFGLFLLSRGRGADARRAAAAAG